MAQQVTKPASASDPSANGADNWAAQLRKGSLELAILASLWAKPLYGLEVLRSLESDSDLRVAEGTLYPILSRLRVEGLLDAEWVDAGSGHPRKYYKITKAGRRRVTEMARSWAEFSKKMDGVLAPIGLKG
ncbi:MAG TPA: PadR family transcriptional regulator [Bryobacteraceae bacterium]|nr:PadR family transcriptional regulator [Bryobacteraceae bacterium]